MPRRVRPEPVDLSDAVDDFAVRCKAARMAFIVSGAFGASRRWDGPDGVYWERWTDRLGEAGRARDERAELELYEEALARSDALDVFDAQLARAARQAELNTPAEMARRRAELRSGDAASTLTRSHLAAGASGRDGSASGGCRPPGRAPLVDLEGNRARPGAERRDTP